MVKVHNDVEVVAVKMCYVNVVEVDQMQSGLADTEAEEDSVRCATAKHEDMLDVEDGDHEHIHIVRSEPVAYALEMEAPKQRWEDKDRALKHRALAKSVLHSLASS